MEETKRLNSESFTDYFVRLFENKKAYQLNCQDIAELLNKESGEDYTESKWRKEFAAFNRGRVYERERLEGGVYRKILCLSDFHYPFQLPIETFKDYCGYVDILVINGDLLDMQSISKFQKAYRVNFMEEIIGCRQYTIDLIEYIQPRQVIFTSGNHEKRMSTYLQKNIDSELKELMPETALDLIVNDGFYHYDKRTRSKTHYEPIKDMFPGIEIEYNGDWYVTIGKTIFAHPSTYSSGMLKTAEKAVDWAFRNVRDFDCMVMAHTHKLGTYVQGGVYLFEQGCLCKTEEMLYMDGKLTLPQQKGFVLIAQDKDGSVLFDKCKLVQL